MSEQTIDQFWLIWALVGTPVVVICIITLISDSLTLIRERKRKDRP